MHAELNCELRIANCELRLMAIRISLIVALICLLTGACSRTQSQPEGSVAESRFAMEEGRHLYQRYCSVCHGSEGRGEGAFFASNLTPPPTDFTAPEWAPSDDDLVAAITAGSAARAQSDLCPAWGKTFSRIEIQYLAAHIRELKREASTAGSQQEQ